MRKRECGIALSSPAYFYMNLSFFGGERKYPRISNSCSYTTKNVGTLAVFCNADSQAYFERHSVKVGSHSFFFTHIPPIHTHVCESECVREKRETQRSLRNRGRPLYNPHTYLGFISIYEVEYRQKCSANKFLCRKEKVFNLYDDFKPSHVRYCLVLQ